MTTARFLRVAMKRWYVLLVGLLLTVGAMAFIYLHAPTVYWGRSKVTILQPDPNPLRAEGSILTGLASALVVRANGGPTGTKTSSPDTTLYGEGVLQGTRVKLQDLGRQWTTSIPDPIIFVEAVGPTRDYVSTEINGEIDALTADLADLQSGLGVGKGNRVFLQVSPQEPDVVEISGNRTRALGATLLLGALLTSVALFLVNRRWPTKG